MIYTGYFAKVKQYENAGLTTVSISGKAPDFYKGPEYKGLAPRWQMFSDWKKGKIDNFGYTKLFNQYLGACECPKCGQWYNLSGQELNPVNTWSQGDDW